MILAAVNIFGHCLDDSFPDFWLIFMLWWKPLAGEFHFLSFHLGMAILPSDVVAVVVLPDTKK